MERRDPPSFFKTSLKSCTNDRFIKNEHCTKIKNLPENFFIFLFFEDLFRFKNEILNSFATEVPIIQKPFH